MQLFEQVVSNQRPKESCMLTSPEKSEVDGRAISGQSYKASTIVIYDSRVVPDLKIPHITTLDS